MTGFRREVFSNVIAGGLEPVAKRTTAILFLFCALQAGSTATAQDADPAVIDAGMRVYNSTVECEICHGWTGRGGPANDEPENDPGPSLVLSELDRDTMIELVACGTPGGQMPQYLATAWTEARPCYGMTAADQSPQRRPPRPDRTLRPGQIEAVVTYVREVYQGKEMTLDTCIKYYSPTSRACNRYR